MVRFRPIALLCFLSLSTLALGSSAYAQAEDPEVVAQAKVHYKAGLEAYKAGKYDVAIRELKKAYLLKRLALVEAALTERPYLTGEAFTIVDAYLFTVTNWADFVGVDLSSLPGLLAFKQRVAARKAVRDAMLAEGLIAA